MIRNVAIFLRKISPFLAVIILWRLQIHFWNPGGILALIPIFYYSFVRPIHGWTVFSVLFCFLIDYNFDTKLFWTTMYFIAYAVNGFQYFIDLQCADKNAIVPFMIFLGASLFILMVANISWTVIGRSIALFIWMSAIYSPIINVLKRLHRDD